MRIKIVLFALACILMMGIGMAYAEEGPKTGATASVSVMSQYVWRGLVLGRETAIQPSLDFTYGNFGANIWNNYATGEDAGSQPKTMSESDLTLRYAYAIDKLTLGAGYIHYGAAGANTEEVYVSASYDTIMTPTVTYYQDISEGDAGGFMTIAGNYSVPVNDKLALGLGATVGIDFNDLAMGTNEDGKKFSGLYYGEVVASATYAVNKAFSIKPSLAYDFSLGKDAKYVMENLSASEGKSSIIYGGVTAAIAF